MKFFVIYTRRNFCDFKENLVKIVESEIKSKKWTRSDSN